VTRTTDTLDGRRSVLRLTRQGAALLRKAPRAIQEDLVDGFALLTPSQRRGLAIGLEKWLTASGLSGAHPAMLFDKPFLTGRKRVAKRQK
jgi:hypothetical protein